MLSWSLLGLILAELCAVVVLGLLLAQPMEQPSLEQAGDEVTACVLDSALKPDQVREVNQSVAAWSDAFMVEHDIGPRVAAALHSFEGQALTCYHVSRGLLQADPSTQALVQERIAGRRKKVLVGAWQLLGRTLAQRYEQELFDTWDRAWVDQLGGRSAGLHARSLAERIPAPSGEREGRRDR
jgi:hypothetical protein